MGRECAQHGIGFAAEVGECMQQQLVSVIVPAYNAEPFIARTLRSALQQTYGALEIIIIDDGSTDSTRAVACAVAEGDKRVRIISVPNGGVANARNIGISEAAGELVAFLDADDLWHPTKIAHQVAALDEMKSAAAVYVLSRDIDIDDRVLTSGKPVVFNGYTFARHLYMKPIGNGSSLMVRRESALAVAGFESSWAARGIGGCEDLDFELKLAARYPIAAVPLYLVGYRLSPGQMSNNKLRMARAAIGTITSHIVACPQLPDWAAKAVLAEVSAYAVANYTKGRHWRLAGLAFLHLCRADLTRALKVAGWLLKQEIMSRIRQLSAAKSRTPERPLFFDIDPSFGVDVSLSTRGARDRAIIPQLSSLDAVLELTMGHQDERAHSQYTARSRSGS
jgi:glycosyltransferase involved in cell wall biosynthesis